MPNAQCQRTQHDAVVRFRPVNLACRYLTQKLFHCNLEMSEKNFANPQKYIHMYKFTEPACANAQRAFADAPVSTSYTVTKNPYQALKDFCKSGHFLHVDVPPTFGENSQKLQTSFLPERVMEEIGRIVRTPPLMYASCTSATQWRFSKFREISQRKQLSIVVLECAIDSAYILKR